MFSKFRGLRIWMMSLGILALITTVGFVGACSSSALKTQVDGQALFNADCSKCHTMGGGNLVGPDLKGVTERQSQQWLINFISNSNQVIASGDPTANALLKQFNNTVMPNMGLTNDQALAVISFLGGQSGAALDPPSTAAALTSAATGNPDIGKAIFTQEVALANGGPACIGCHSIDNAGILGGGVLGPNLTQASVKYGDTRLAARLANITFRTMKVVFAGHPLTASEQSDLVAFIKSAAGQPEPNREWIIIGISVIGFLAVLVLSGVIWRGRLLGVRRQLVERARTRK